MSHTDIFFEILLIGVGQLVLLGVFIFQHRLMWKDFSIRHKLNGDKKSAGMQED